MRKLLFAAVASLGLAACVPTIGNLPSTPATVANETLLDERAAIAVESAYAGARTVLEALVDAGMITGTSASRAAELDRQAYSAVQRVRAAYRAGNADSYAEAVNDARRAIAGLLGAVKGN